MSVTASRRSPFIAAATIAALGLIAVPAHAHAHTDRGTAPSLPEVSASVETPSLFDDEAGGNANADDPAIWRNASDPDRSLVIATAKEGGLRVYDLDGRQVQTLPAPPPPRDGDKPGRFNNVDLITGLRFPDGRHDVAVVSDRGRDQLRFYRIDPGRPGGPLVDVTDEAAAPLVFSSGQDEVDDQRTAYGLAAYTDRGRSFAVTSRRHDTKLALAELTPDARGKVGYRLVRTLTLPSSFTLPDGTGWTPCAEPGELPQVEGMVIDPDSGDLYAGQEDVGIWKLDADLRSPARLIEKVRSYGVPGTWNPQTEECDAGADPGFGGRHISADVEGLTIWRDPEDPRDEGYLIASSQGDNTFAVFDRDHRNAFVRSFRITAGGKPGAPDGSEVCDGAAVTSAPLGTRFPHGLLVVQDGSNTPETAGPDGQARTDTDFKFVDWAKVERAARL
ncbi:phytase [Streptomyces sp. NBC_00555]|uniref:phytase n=1 Tax=Streptomyces sp. NBC_00555 TaxID=2903662 RepID=UPI00224DC1DA|nr:phytase [Streptomyces sp. NBC_00555]MCX5015444.1 phytase [Streptomyces sp. NBC_00555]